MKIPFWEAWLVALACSGSLSALAAPQAQASQSPATGPSFYDNFAGMQLLDQAGRPLQLHRLRGKVVLFNFIFTGCSTVCPVQTHALSQMLRRMQPALRARVHLVSVSLDPLSDTPQTLATFAKGFQVDHAQWSFATGRTADIQRLAEALWLFRDGRGQAPLDDHATSLWLVDAQGGLRIRYAGNPPDTARLERELGALAELKP
jgi:protein SCO1